MAESGAPYAHLHVHTEYSMLDGAARLKDLFSEVKNQGMTHVAITDHGNMYGAAEFHRQAKDAGVTPVIGIEAYVAPEARGNTTRVLWGQPHQKKDDVSASGAYLHKTIWARDNQGLHNLFRLSSRSYAEGMLAKWPRMDKEILAEHSKGLMASTGCPSGELQTRLRLGQYDEALKAAAEWQDIFGKENYFLELMDHGIEIERRVRDGLPISAKSSASRRWSPTTRTTPGSRTRSRTTCSCASRPARACPTRTGSGSTAPATSSSPPPRCTPSTAVTCGRRAAATASC
jgi:DNA polymerase-3 subunit alpha